MTTVWRLVWPACPNQPAEGRGQVVMKGVDGKSVPSARMDSSKAMQDRAVAGQLINVEHW